MPYVQSIDPDGIPRPKPKPKPNHEIPIGTIGGQIGGFPGQPGPAVVGNGRWMGNTGTLWSMLTGGKAASHAALPGLLSRQPIPGLFGGSPYYGQMPWGMDPVDIRTLMLQQQMRAMAQQPGKTRL